MMGRTYCRKHLSGMHHLPAQNLKMAPVSVNQRIRMAMLFRVLRARSRRRALQQSLILFSVQRQMLVKVYLHSLLLLLHYNVVSHDNRSPRRQRTCRRLPGNTGWWTNVKNKYSDEQFKKVFRVSRETFS